MVHVLATELQFFQSVGLREVRRERGIEPEEDHDAEALCDRVAQAHRRETGHVC